MYTYIYTHTYHGAHTDEKEAYNDADDQAQPRSLSFLAGHAGTSICWQEKRWKHVINALVLHTTVHYASSY